MLRSAMATSQHRCCLGRLTFEKGLRRKHPFRLLSRRAWIFLEYTQSGSRLTTGAQSISPQYGPRRPGKVQTESPPSFEVTGDPRPHLFGYRSKRCSLYLPDEVFHKQADAIPILEQWPWSTVQHLFLDGGCVQSWNLHRCQREDALAAWWRHQPSFRDLNTSPLILASNSKPATCAAAYSWNTPVGDMRWLIGESWTGYLEGGRERFQPPGNSRPVQVGPVHCREYVGRTARKRWIIDIYGEETGKINAGASLS